MVTSPVNHFILLILSSEVDDLTVDFSTGSKKVPVGSKSGKSLNSLIDLLSLNIFHAMILLLIIWKNILQALKTGFLEYKLMWYDAFFLKKKQRELAYTLVNSILKCPLEAMFW